MQIRRFVLLAGLLLVGVLRVQGQVEPAFEAIADANQVLVNSYFEIAFQLKNAQGQDFQPPDFEGFRILSGPNRAISTSIINGKVRREITYTYTLQPKMVGELQIGTARITVDGDFMYTRPVTIRVLEGDPAAGQDRKDFYVRPRLNVETAYVGQQIVLDYNLYTKVDIQSFNILEEPQYSGFYATEAKRFNSPLRREVIDGVQYMTKSLKRVILFPQQTGRLTIDPLEMQLGVTAKDNNSGGIVFYNRNVHRVPYVTEPVSILVKPLPGLPPPSFTGGVGDFDLVTQLSRTEVTTDDALTLKLVISGPGDIKRVQAPPLALPPGLEAYEPIMASEKMTENAEGIINRRVFEYVILPKDTGTYVLEPEFSYFDPDSARYVIYREDTYTIRVRPGRQGPSLIDSTTTSDGAQMLEDIHYLKQNVPLRSDRSPLIRQPVFWAGVSLPFALFGFLLLGRRKQRLLNEMDPQLLARKGARKAALKRLAQAERHLKAREPKPFYDEVSRALLGYAENKLDIPPAQLYKHVIQERLEAASVPAGVNERFIQILKNCEKALYAGMDNLEAMQATYQDALTVLTTIEKHGS